LSLTAATLLGAGVLLMAPGANPSAKADNCPDVSVTFARGTDEPQGLGRVGEALVDALRQNTGKNIDAYAVNYRATLLQIHGNDGAKDAIKHIKDVADKCPATPQVLGGYSQGASVVDIVTGTQIGGVGWGDSLPPQYASHVVAVTSIGVSTHTYVSALQNFFFVKDLVSGLIKAVFFGAIIGWMGCYYGFQTEGGAEGVGIATTRAVVSSCVLVLITDYVLANVLFRFIFAS